MPANTIPVFVGSPNFSECSFSTADTSRTAPTHAVLLLTPGTNGGLLHCVKIVATATTSADVVRIFTLIGSTYYLLYEMLIPAVTPSSTVQVASGLYIPESTCWLPSTATVYVTTNGGQAYNAFAFSENY